MAQYIDKAALVAEIESYKDSFCDRNGNLEDSETNGLVYDTLCELEYSINALEVKEVDLEKEIESSMNNLCELGCYTQSLLDNPEAYEFAKPFPKEVDDELVNFARHFFELGIKTQKGE